MSWNKLRISVILSTSSSYDIRYVFSDLARLHVAWAIATRSSHSTTFMTKTFWATARIVHVIYITSLFSIKLLCWEATFDSTIVFTSEIIITSLITFLSFIASLCCSLSIDTVLILVFQQLFLKLFIFAFIVLLL